MSRPQDTQTATPRASDGKRADGQAVHRMTRHRKRYAEIGFRQVATHLPEEIIDFIDRQRLLRGLSSRGHVLAALIAETDAYQREQEGSPAE